MSLSSYLDIRIAVHTYFYQLFRTATLIFCLKRAMYMLML